MKKIRAIPTEYNRYKFRSRLEARWAVYFDSLGIEYEYEKEGYDLGKVGRYLPDFWLPQVNMWAEIKGKPFTKTELLKCEALAKHTGYECLLLSGLPDVKMYFATDKLDYMVTDYHNYCFDEHRFFCNCGYSAEYPFPFDADNFEYEDSAIEAIKAARSARFEFGQTPSVHRR